MFQAVEKRRDAMVNTRDVVDVVIAMVEMNALGQLSQNLHSARFPILKSVRLALWKMVLKHSDTPCRPAPRFRVSFRELCRKSALLPYPFFELTRSLQQQVFVPGSDIASRRGLPKQSLVQPSII